MKDLLRTINSCVADAVVPLPSDLLDVIQAFLDKNEAIEESDSQRLNEELLAIYHKDVDSKPDRYFFFLALLRHLRPVLKGKRLLEWWDLLHVKIFNSLTKQKGLANEAQLLLETLVDDDDGEGSSEATNTSAALFKKLVRVWLDNCDAKSAEDPAAHLIKSQIQYSLLKLGRKRTKEFLNAVNELFVQKIHRLQVLPLLCSFIQYQPPRLHELLQTPLFNNLLRCLTTDTSTTVVSLAISALVMFLPNIPFSMSKHLPSLFNIYSRLLFWDRQCTTATQEGDELGEASDAQSDASEEDTTWEKISYSFESDDSKVPELLQYFTFLYGLYPINFMDYVRKPQRYLRHANYPGSEKFDIEPLEIRQRSEPFRQLHLLHPNFFNMTIEKELEDANRFLKIDAPDIITNCMALCTPLYSIENPVVIPETPGPRQVYLPDDDIPDIPLLDREEDDKVEELTSQESHETTRISGLAHKASIIDSAASCFGSPMLVPQADSPTLGPHMRVPASRTSLQDMLNSQKNLRGIFKQPLVNGSSHSVASSNLYEETESAADLQPQSLEEQSLDLRPASWQPASNAGDYVASLQREILLLRNDLNFERYLKQQHLSHIGQLRRLHVREATVEAETQNLINSNRSLKSKLEEAKRSNLQVKKEAEKSRSSLKRWEADLTSKLRLLRGEQKKWAEESEVLHRDLEIAQGNCKKLRQLVVDGEAKEQSWNQQIESTKHILEENELLKLELEQQTETLRQLEDLGRENDFAKENEAIALSKVNMLNSKLQAADSELEQVKKYYDSQIDDLRLKLEEATRDPQRRQLKGFQNMVDSALAVSRIKISELQNEQTNLLKRYTKLEHKLLQLQENRSLEYDDKPILSEVTRRARTSYRDEQSTTGTQHYSPIRPTRTLSDQEIESSLPNSLITRTPTLSSSYPDRPNHGRIAGYPTRLDTPTSSSPSSARTFADRFNLGSKGSLEGQRSFEVDSRVHPQSESGGQGRGSGSEKKDKKKKAKGAMKGIRGFV